VGAYILGATLLIRVRHINISMRTACFGTESPINCDQSS